MIIPDLAGLLAHPNLIAFPYKTVAFESGFIAPVKEGVYSYGDSAGFSPASLLMAPQAPTKSMQM